MINKLFTNKKVASTLAAISIVALLLSGTFAWMDYDQHKSNEVYGEGKKYEVTLNEDFTGKTHQDVKANTPVNKDISVSNTGLTNGVYGDLYIRVQLKEFMEKYTGEYTNSPERLMVAAPEPYGENSLNFVEYMNDKYTLDAKFNDANITSTETTRVDGKMVSYGNFITFDTSAAAQAFADALKLEFPEYYASGEGSVDATPRVVSYPALDDLDLDDKTPVTRYYISTQAKDPNGQYGKYLPLTYTINKDNPVPITGTENFSSEAQIGAAHDLGTLNCWEWQDGNPEGCPQDNPHTGEGYNHECDYPLHKWLTTIDPAKNLSTNDSSKYFSWQLGADVIPLSEWTGNQVKKWILDPTGWAYWGEPLAPGQTTSNLMDSFTLYGAIDDPFYYVIHTDMEAVSQVDLNQWKDAPKEFIGAFGPAIVKTDKTALNIAISDAGKVTLTNYSPETAKAVEDALANAIAVKADPESSQIQIDDAAASLATALGKLSGDKTELGQDIEAANAFDRTQYSPENIAQIEAAIAAAQAVYDKKPVTQAEIDAAKTALDAAITGTTQLANKKALQDQLDRISTLVQADYSTASWSAMQAKVAPANSAIGDVNATQAAVDTATANLKTAIDGLVNTKALVDAKTASASAYATPATYTAATFAPFKTAYDNATAVLAKPNATQAEVDAAKTALTDAKTALQLKTVSSVTVAPATANVAKGAKQPFTATVNGNGISQNVTWSINSTTSTISSTGELTVAPGETATSIVVTATSVDDPTKKGTATVTVTDKAALNTAITKAGGLTQSEYTAATWGAMQTALTAANAAKTNTTATQAQIDTATTDLNNAMNALSGDKVPLTSVVAAAKAIDRTKFSPTSLAKIDAAIATADAVLSKLPVTQTEINAAKVAFDAAMSSTPKLADKTALQAEIARTTGLLETQYSPASWSTMQSRLTTAKAADLNVDATQATVDAETATLKPAIDGLVKTIDLTDEVATSAVEIAKESQYTKASFAAFKAANQAALDTLALPTPTQAQIDAAKTALANARAGLLPLVVTGVTVDTTPTATTTVTKGNTLPFVATVDGTNVTPGPNNVTWSITGGTTSTIDPVTGVLTVPLTETAVSLTVTATSKDDPTKSGTFMVTLKTPLLPPGATVGTLFKADGIDWVILAKDGKNFLVATRGTIGPAQEYANAQANTIDPWFNSLTTMKAAALPVTILPECNDLYNAATSATKVAATGTPQAFMLSIGDTIIAKANVPGVLVPSPNTATWHVRASILGGKYSQYFHSGTLYNDSKTNLRESRPGLWITEK